MREEKTWRPRKVSEKNSESLTIQMSASTLIAFSEFNETKSLFDKLTFPFLLKISQQRAIAAQTFFLLLRALSCGHREALRYPLDERGPTF